MRLGAVLIAAGKNANPMMPSGEITVAQRMIASLQKAGVTIIAVVTGPEDKKMEKQLAQYGVFFLRNPQPELEQNSIRMGLAYLEGKTEAAYLMTADRPLVDPDTIMMLKEADVPFVIPTFRGRRGQPLMVKQQYARRIMDAKDLAAAADLPFLTELTAEDPGTVLTAAEAAGYTELIGEHERKITRLIPDFSINRGKTLVDGKLVALLRLIRETQSVRDACSRMQISYSTAWNLLNAAEDAFGYQLILRNKGGPSGAGSLLTERGNALLTAGEQFEAAARESLESLYNVYFRDVI